jgi:hypothetical protein
LGESEDGIAIGFGSWLLGFGFDCAVVGLLTGLYVGFGGGLLLLLALFTVCAAAS